MSQLIAGTYEVISQLGSGGGAIVYLARHIRLEKLVVLKADKRSLTTNISLLRREVDALKSLSHSYIPQVYDFFIENATVYAVIDFIEGESFDKPLKRGEKFTQPQIIKFACQLLEALDYLHSRPTSSGIGIVHSDIKPANIMLTPQNEIRLIDFNIALALGAEEKIAGTPGYASPEHYGLNFSTSGSTEDIALNDTTVTMIGDTIEIDITTSSSYKKRVIPDIRSDIYSLGASLYHMLTGNKPNRHAKEVVPLTEQDCSITVAMIINKAMNPNPDLRYQSASEMLDAFQHLRDNDPRVRRWKRLRNATCIVLVATFILGGIMTFIGLRQSEAEQRRFAEQERSEAENQRVEAENQRIEAASQRAEAENQRIEADKQRAEAELQEAYALAAKSADALRNGNKKEAITYALDAMPTDSSYNQTYTPDAQKALTDALNIYDLSDGFKMYGTVELPSTPLFMQISPSGKTAAVVYAYDIAVIDTELGEITKTLPIEPSALSEVKYLSENIIIYAGVAGIKAYDISSDTELWSGKSATTIAVSADGKVVAAIYKDDQVATVYDSSSGMILSEINFDGKRQRVTVNDSFANPNDNLLALNKNGSLLGVSFSDGSLWIYNPQDRESDIELLDAESGYTHFEGGFNGDYFAFSASNTVSSEFAVIDTVALEQTGGYNSTFPFSVQTDESGVYLQTENILVKIDPLTGDQVPLATVFEEITQFAHSSSYALITVKDEYIFFEKNAVLLTRYEKEYGSEFIQITEDTAIIGSLDSPVIRIMMLEAHPEAELFSYDPTYQHDEARLSADKDTVMLFSFDRFRLYDIEGTVIAEVAIPDADQVYDQQYRRDESDSRLEVIYNDGTIRAYSAEDGSLLCETTGEKPDLRLYEEFFTDTLRIESPLHGTPAAYDRETGKLVRELEKDAYLTYVTQVDDYIITEYITGDGERYGLLLNSQCETLAKLPYLCDIVDDELIFDYSTGNLRKSRIYHIDELIELAREQISN